MHYAKWRKYGDPLSGNSNETHGMVHSPEYKSWQKMKERCYSKSSNRYKNYGGRGIKVCDRWNNSFILFLEDMGNRPENTSIDRIDIDSDYELTNCRWATPLEQANNMTTNHKLTFNNKTMNISEWSREIEISQATLYHRIFIYKWSIEKALTKPVRKAI
jgi:hypothetical protein